MNQRIHDIARQAEEPWKLHLQRQRIARQDRERLAYVAVYAFMGGVLFALLARGPVRAFLGW